MKKTLYSLATIFVAVASLSGCKDGNFGGDYVVEGVELQDMCGTWVCTAESNDPWFTVNYYSEKYDPQFLNDYFGAPFGVTSPDANGDDIVDEKDFALYTEQELWYDEVGSKVEIITSNTAANNTSEMLITDGLWNEVYKVNVNPNDKTFSVGSVAEEAYEPLMITPVTIHKTYKNGERPVVLGGKILKGAATAPGSGLKTDSIIFYVKYADDYGPDMYYKVSGYLKTGYTEDH